jgi:hypothetical protein
MRRTAAVAAAVAITLVAGACSRSSGSRSRAAIEATASGLAPTSTGRACDEPLQATEVGVTPTTITIEVMADVGSPLAPGVFQGNIDAINAFAASINQHGGLACRQLVVRTWDSKLDPTESKNGQIDACQNALAMVGTNALFNPDVSPMTGCVDKGGKPTGLPDIAALSADVNEQCAPTTFNIEGIQQKCPFVPGPIEETEAIGPFKWFGQREPNLHGLFLVAGDLPSTVQAEVPQIAAIQEAGVVWDGTPKVSGADSQPSYTSRVALAKAKASTFIYDGSNDIAMVRMRKEADAQGGLPDVKVWACSITCYTRAFLAQGGADVEGTYLWLPFLPFEEASYNAEDQAYVNAVGLSKVDSFGANGWQAAIAFEDAVKAVVATGGPNAITRANLLAALRIITNFSANGWLGPKNLAGPGAVSPCFLIMEVQGGRFARVYPTKPGTMDCNAKDLVTLTVDPAAGAAKIG